MAQRLSKPAVSSWSPALPLLARWVLATQTWGWENSSRPPPAFTPRLSCPPIDNGDEGWHLASCLTGTGQPQKEQKAVTTAGKASEDLRNKNNCTAAQNQMKWSHLLLYASSLSSPFFSAKTAHSYSKLIQTSLFASSLHSASGMLSQCSITISLIVLATYNGKEGCFLYQCVFGGTVSKLTKVSSFVFVDIPSLKPPWTTEFYNLLTSKDSVAWSTINVFNSHYIAIFPSFQE